LIATANLQVNLDLISQWYSKWRIKLYHNKSVLGAQDLYAKTRNLSTCIYGQDTYSAVCTVKYLGSTIDTSQWYAHENNWRSIGNLLQEILFTPSQRQKSTYQESKYCNFARSCSTLSEKEIVQGPSNLVTPNDLIPHLHSSLFLAIKS